MPPPYDSHLCKSSQTLFSALRAVRSVQMTGAASPPEASWQLEASAGVQVSEISSGLLLQENGQLVRDGLPVSYTASWSFETDETGHLWLGHARRGAPVRLLILQPAGEGRWISEQPHLCGDDRYEARITLQTDRAVQLCWKTSGPKKQHVITRTFSPYPLTS